VRKEYAHQPVLTQEVLQGLNVQPGGIYLDGTFGRGGHAQAILQRLDADGRLVVIDKDPEAIRVAEETIAKDSRVTVQRGSYAMLQRLAEKLDISGELNGVLLDLGVSSPQLDDCRRGFSFSAEGPLDMRMDPDTGISAAQWLAQATQIEIEKVLRSLGEERYARRIAKAIVLSRNEIPITTTTQFAELVASAVPKRERKKHPATRSFQAIRIYINRELEELNAALLQIAHILAPLGRLVVISFHSLEDRIVKQFIRRESKGEELPLDLPVQGVPGKGRLRPIGKPIFPGTEEIAANPRARSAVLRVAEKLA